MAVEVNSVGTGVEISWDEMGSGDVGGGGGTAPPEFPPYPDNSLPGEQPEIDNELPGEQPRPSHPIYLPPYIDNSLPGDQPVIDNSLPEIEEIGLSDEQIEKLKEFLEGNLPSTGEPPHPTPVSGKGGKQIAVQVFAQGQDGDWSNTAVQPNDGLALLRFPSGFSGESYVEVRALDGSLIDSGTIQVGAGQE
jgi:hypothetical protein